ncbi:divergent AAA domain-containing protein [Candidatus Methanoperedens nitroreducens]|uniref:Divergent AAA domain-containing protein n=1 Tax=Candidatus Methanoperedens nitratireducens TaxID=1392998 RepID=A0A062V920_9EURY|nr:ATP-binding protein [Candidatus Methanoperedens nitroreducens]KCZ71850.1 divergent AAA domain-containing protein [Candidatus Methanoperedens nitroreducens]MDJ1422175.1 ATP-binding protein [Candidatus Methanoperedens sp.]
MREVVGGIVINEVEAEPLSDYVVDFLISQRKESPILDFKKIISIRKDSDFPEIAKDIFAFSNYGGGWILIGWEETSPNMFVPVGLPEDYKVDQATLQEKFNSFTDSPIELLYKELNKDFKDLFIKAKEEVRQKVNSISNKFAIIFIPPSYILLKPNKEGKYKKGEKEKVVFSKDEYFYRRGTQNIHPSSYELQLIKKRLEKEQYRLSVLSGEPDKISEKIYSNLFKVTKMPEYVYIGQKKDYDNVSIKVLLKQEGIFPEWQHKFKIWNNSIVTFENLAEEYNSYRKLVIPQTIRKESIETWLDDEDKNRIIVELLNREMRHYAIAKGLYYFENKNKFYYTLEEDNRKEQWHSRYRRATKEVAAKMYAEQLKDFIYWHVAFSPNFIQLGRKGFFYRILPTFVITDDGRNPRTGPEEGTIITRLSYDRYNSMYLNTVLFWMHQLGNGGDIQIGDYLTISSEPLTVELPVGIIYDIPSSEFRLEIDDELNSESYEGTDFE